MHVLFRFTLLIIVVFSFRPSQLDAAAYKKLQLTDKFYCEGAYYADFNRDGAMDVVSGPFWYEGPGFKVRHEVHTPKAYDPHGYSENFLTYTGDFNGDGWVDIYYAPWPGKDSVWYENPGKEKGHWKAHPALKNVGNESPVWGDVTGDGQPELIYNIDGYLGYGTWGQKQPERPWVFHPVSTKGKYQRYTHGAGFGDINGDGRVDILESVAWWEQPAKPKPGEPWIRHDYVFAQAGAQLLVYDVDGDGLNDVITTWHAHHYGLLWHEQVRGDDGGISFKRHEILSPTPDLKSDALRISQLHALDLADMDGDGIKDLVTGKRFWAHGPKGDKEPNAPAVVYWFGIKRSADGVTFVPHQIDDDSGVGTQVAAADLNGDKTPDVIVGNKKGTFVFLSVKKGGQKSRPKPGGIGVGAPQPAGADILLDGTRKLVDEKWTYWKGPRFSSSLPIKWQMVDDPVDDGKVLVTSDPAADGGKYGAADIVTKKKYRDFRLHVEFLIPTKGGNSGVYLQNRYEIQVLDGGRGKHGMAAVINERAGPYDAYNGTGKWNSYDIKFRAARFRDGMLVEKALVTMYFNGVKAHTNQRIQKVWGGPNSGVDGGNRGGAGITDTAEGLKLQCEGHRVLYRNAWITPLEIEKPDTDF